MGHLVEEDFSNEVVESSNEVAEDAVFSNEGMHQDEPATEEVVASAPSGVVHAPPLVATPNPQREAQKRRHSTLTAQERKDANMLAELHSILITTEHLESAFVRGSLSNQEYERHCIQLIAQFKTLQTGLRSKYPDIRVFIHEEGLNCPLAEERLLGKGMAATAFFHGNAQTKGGKESLACFEASEKFITLSDALKLKLTAVDDLLPLIRDLQTSIVSIPNLPPLHGIDRVPNWLAKLNNMQAADQLNQGDCRQLALDIELGYNSLRSWLQDKT